MKAFCIAILLLSVSRMLALPPPPWFSERVESGDIDAGFFTESYADARQRGVDGGNPLYGPDNHPFGPDGAFSNTDDGMNVLIILVDFSDNVSQVPPVFFDSLGFAADTFSLKRYYSEVSFGQIDIVTVNYPSVTGWQRAPEAYEYYVDNNYGWGSYPTNSQGLVEDVCGLVDPVIDFTDYDNDGDGTVDGVNVIYAGRFDGTPQTIWPHMWSLPGAGTLFDGVYVNAYSVQNEYDSNPGDKSANTICHEFGHVMGLPDLYDYDYDSSGIGNWGLMSYGVYNGGGWSPAHFCAWSLASLGIVSPQTVVSSGYYDVLPVEEDGTVYRLWTGGAGGNQYFLVENRRPIGYDGALPGFGILIWHIDDSVNSNNNQWYPGYTSHGHYHVALEQADGLWGLEHYQGYGDDEDPFPGPSGQNADTFNFWTVPDSRDYNFQDTYVEVSSIPESADSVSLYMSVDQTGIGGEGWSSPYGLLSSVNNPVSGSAVFILSHGGGRVSVNIYDVSGRCVSTILSGELSEGSYRISWELADPAPGVYFARYSGGGAVSAVKFLLSR